MGKINLGIHQHLESIKLQYDIHVLLECKLISTDKPEE